MTKELVHGIGYTAQVIFASRFFVQWWYSEKSKKVVSPVIFWQLSLLASILLLLYSILMRDLPIMAGQLIGYFIYVRNLQLAGIWLRFPKLLRVIVIFIPIGAVAWLVTGHTYNWKELVQFNNNVLLLLWGLLGQLVFISRFVYQWMYAEKKNDSVFPFGFWVLSIAGAVLISSYAFYCGLYPIIIGHAFGMVVYVRNIMIHKTGQALEKEETKMKV